MQHYVRKSLIVGLGGTGYNAVVNIKKHVKEIYGEIPRTTGFLVIDTADQDSQDDESGLSSDEFIKLTVRDPQTLINTPQVTSWFPANDKVAVSHVVSGAKQVRALGRLALYANTDIFQRIRNKVNEVNSWKAQLMEKDNKFRLFDGGDRAYVSVISSLAGGTGSGMFLDIAFILRACVRKTDMQTAFLVLPRRVHKQTGHQECRSQCLRGASRTGLSYEFRTRSLS